MLAVLAHKQEPTIAKIYAYVMPGLCQWWEKELVSGQKTREGSVEEMTVGHLEDNICILAVFLLFGLEE